MYREEVRCEFVHEPKIDSHAVGWLARAGLPHVLSADAALKLLLGPDGEARRVRENGLVG